MRLGHGSIAMVVSEYGGPRDRDGITESEEKCIEHYQGSYYSLNMLTRRTGKVRWRGWVVSGATGVLR